MLKKRILWLALLTLIAFPLLGAGIFYLFSDKPLSWIFRSEINIFVQILAGLAIGASLALTGQFIISRKFMEKIKSRYADLLGKFKLTVPEIIFISFCAGFGEEILFRGAIQPLLGIWLTAIIFVAIHGYLNPRDWRLSVYGVFMTFAIALLGYLTEIWGIYTAIAAHTAIDIVLFLFLFKDQNNFEEEEREFDKDPLKLNEEFKHETAED